MLENFPFIRSNIPTEPAHGVNISAPSPPVTLLFVPPKYSKSSPVPASMLLLNLGTGDDHGKVFGNKYIVYLGEGNDELEVASHDSVIFAGSGNFVACNISSFSKCPKLICACAAK
jgi:hypothetical protein